MISEHKSLPCVSIFDVVTEKLEEMKKFYFSRPICLSEADC